MAELYPMSFDRLMDRAVRELSARDAIYDLPRRKWWRGKEGLDPSVNFLGRPAANAVGPAAGPQSQLVQNIVLAWLAGARIFELKTVQILDTLDIPRPCIDARNIGYNVEWSQELTLERSLQEYVAAWVALHVLRELDPVGRREVVQDDSFVFDMSVGYDLKGIQSERVSAWIAGMRDATQAIDALRSQIKGPLAAYRDVEIPSCISDSITLSTFHGCPPGEIEKIGEHILTTLDMDLIIKLNPTLLGYDRVCSIIGDKLGYEHVTPVEEAFDEDLKWADAIPLLIRLKRLAASRGRQFGIKLTNTLVVENRGDFFSDERMYLSGQPLHVLAMNLLLMLRQETAIGMEMPVSFSAGIDRKNYADAVSLGLTPVTTCTDLLRPGGYGRLSSYCNHLEKRMAAVGATDIPSFIRQTAGVAGAGVQTAEAALANTRRYVATLVDDPRYGAAKNKATPKKIGSHLSLFDCINCDKCVPVCPNNANFAYELSPEELNYSDLIVDAAGGVTEADAQVFNVDKAHQLACYADFCNECGNCDIFCPEEGGPYVEKPLLFGSMASWREFPEHEGYTLEVDESGARRFRGRMRGVEVSLLIDGAVGTFSDGVVEVDLAMSGGLPVDVRVVSIPALPHHVVLERAFALRAIYKGVYEGDGLNWASASV